MVIPREKLLALLKDRPADEVAMLERVATRIRTFAEKQLASLKAFEITQNGIRMGQTIEPLSTAGCYAPGGRFPLPSSVLMTAIPARVAGVETVVVCSPRPHPTTLAAAAIAGADFFLCLGGVQGIATLSQGLCGLPACQVIVGPGNRWVTAAKQLVQGTTRIDMLAGPSEVVVVADGSSNAELVAADLLAQAEHDPDALSILIALDDAIVPQVERALASQLAQLSTRAICEESLKKAFCVRVDTIAAAADAARLLAPEHLQLVFAGAAEARTAFSHYGALFVGDYACEVLGDYGAGPNHVLPTGGTARHVGGLSVLNYVAVRTWMESLEPAGMQGLLEDCEALARIEGLSAHAQAVALRRK